MSRACGDTVATVTAPIEAGGLEMLGARIGRALDGLDRDGIDIRQAAIRIEVGAHDQHRDEWVAEISWPSEAEPEDYNEPWPFDDEPEAQS